ncbi:MAG: hypothetical protein Q8941_15155 [Bacteroidota bacterium]|nr:hypothetical protein [Bacteroidota bacterium]
MKILLIIAVVILSFIGSTQTNPLKNTKWRKDDLVIYFTAKDTIKLLVEDQLVAAAKYTVKDSLLTWKDLPVTAAYCDTSFTGTYIFRINDDRLSFKTVYDKCEERANVVQTLELVKQ